eukprot:364641-Chlamydomonas_euryale.AAC.10
MVEGGGPAAREAAGCGNRPPPRPGSELRADGDALRRWLMAALSLSLLLEVAGMRRGWLKGCRGERLAPAAMDSTAAVPQPCCDEGG